MFFKFDQWLIGRFEVVSDLVAQLTGINNFSLARICLCLAVATGVLMFLVPPNYLYLVAVIFIFPLYLMLSYAAEKGLEDRQLKGVANPVKLSGLRRRATNNFFLSLILIVSAGGEINTWSIYPVACVAFLWAVEYFLACDVKPPTKSLIRQMMDALTPKPTLVPIPVKK